MTTKKTTNNLFNIDPKKCTLTEMNRELKRIASRKCRAKTEQEKAMWQKLADQLVGIKASRFESTKKKSYMTYTDAEIQGLSLEDTIKGIKSLQSTRCIYPERKAEVLKVEAKYQEHRAHLMDLIKFEELKAKLA